MIITLFGTPIVEQKALSMKQFKKEYQKQNNQITMKKIIVLFAGLFLMSFAAQNLNAQTSATDASATSAHIVKPITLTNNVPLYFGKIVPTSAAGTVEVTPAGARTFAGGALVFQNDPTSFTAAEFTVTGENNAGYSIVLPADGAVTLTGAGTPMPLDDFSTNASGTLNASGTETFQVGATLNVGVNQTPGTYTGSFNVTVAYN